ncbi:MAG: flagellar biosynthesis anti-sigma factor FlgM [SAR324 cluster bacterium]|uniref:Flagellar biosynthesis anti-sigma factor FlgM n=1 Tax=SAR324 cluster bacterium TaxID=2024889 RepID=A0A7X9FRR6_9DELT|nr:flagellar biosynthesis anti-sigma factor FlgM [SAR324 cluster bacterium]
MMDPQKTSKKFAKQLNSLRHKKVLSLKNRIAKGKYKISNLEIAKALFMSQ